jgi:hypothetical protein
VVSVSDLTAFAAALEDRGMFALHVTRTHDGEWLGSFETSDQYADPEQNIAAMIAIIESLPEPHRSAWRTCTRREFNVGYDCGVEPRAFEQALSSELLGRIASIGASVRLTLYANRG